MKVLIGVMKTRTILCLALSLVCSLQSEPTSFGSETKRLFGAVREQLIDPEAHVCQALDALADSCERGSGIESASQEVKQALVAVLSQVQGQLIATHHSHVDKSLERKPSKLGGQVLAMARDLDHEERKAFLERVRTTTIVAMQGGNVAPEHLLVAANKLLGGSELFNFHAQHQDSSIYAIVTATVLYLAFKAARFVGSASTVRSRDNDALLHYVFGPHVRSASEGAVDACFTPLQLAVAPKATINVKPLLSAATLGTVAGLAAVLLK